MDDRLTHEESQGFFKDVLERFASSRGKLWHNSGKRWLLGRSTDFYMLEIGDHGNVGNLMEKFSHAGFSVSPVGGAADKALRASKPKQCYKCYECFRMMPVRAMDLERTKAVEHHTLASAAQHIGHMDGCVATSWEAACNLLLEVEEERPSFSRKRGLLQLAPAPIVWTFVGGDHENRFGFARNSPSKNVPILVGLVSSDAGLGFKGVAEADYLYRKLGRKSADVIPSDTFVFSIDTTTL